MAWARYLLYFAGVTLLTWLLTRLEISYPGSLRLYVIVNGADLPGTSEYSPIEIIQPIVLGACGLLLVWVARYCPSQRPLATLFAGMALAFLLRELDFFFDTFLVRNLWQSLVGITAAVVITHAFRQRRRLSIALARLWPSPALALLFAGAAILFGFVHLVADEALWRSLLGDAYRPVATLAAEEFIELMGYFLWLIGTIEYVYQASAIAYREPQAAAQRLRQRRRHDRQGHY